MEIISQATDGPALKVIQNGNQNIAEFYDGNVNVFTINDIGNVGIGSSVPQVKLDIVGGINFTDSINGISSNVLSYLNDVSSPIQAQINYDSSVISSRITTFESTLTTTSNAISGRITWLDITTSNYASSRAENSVNSWITIGNDIYYSAGNVGIGTSTQLVNELEIYGGDISINNANLKKQTSNYQITRWNDSTNYYFGNKCITYTDGYVGIGTTNPLSKLHVGSDIYSIPSQNLRYFNASTDMTYALTSFTDVCSVFDSSIWVKSTIASSSDERIKKNVIDINDESALQKIMAIQPKTYNYVDANKGTDKVYGFLAQQIKEVIPEAVKTQKDLIPNIYAMGNSFSNIITLDGYISSNNVKNSNIYVIDSAGKSDKYAVVDVKLETNSLILDREIKADKVFVYGTEVNDFHTLDKSYIYTLNVCATQTLSQKVNDIYDVFSNLSMRISALEKL
jgi:hypothetical protein